MIFKIRDLSEVRFLLAASSSDSGEIISNGLRNRGIVANYSHIHSVEELTEELKSEKGIYDLLLISAENGIDVDALVQRVDECAQPIPSIVLAPQGDYNLRVEMIAKGACDALITEEMNHIESVILRMAHHSRMVRKVADQERVIAFHQKRNSDLLESSRDAIAVAMDGLFTYANQSFTDLFKLDIDDIEITSIIDLVHKDDKGDITQFIKKGEVGLSQTFGVTAVRGDGSSFLANFILTPQLRDGEKEIELHAEEIVVDEQIDPDIDTKSGVFTNTAFFVHFQQIVTKIGKGESCGLLMLSLKDFNLAKDAVGLENADALTKEVATLIKEGTRTTDALTLLSENEFILITPTGRMQGLQRLSENLMQRFETHQFCKEQGGGVMIECRIGAHIIVSPREQFSYALSQTKMALQEAVGHDERIGIHNTLANRDSDELWINRILSAVKNDSFLLFYQPLVAINDSKEHIYEVILRMKGKGGEIIMPKNFIPLAEKYDVMGTVDRWVFKQAVMVLLRDRDPQLRLIVKLSTNIFADANLGNVIGNVLRKSGLEGSKLIFEIAEPTLLQNLAQVKPFSSAAKLYGFKLMISGFGVDQNAFSLLNQLHTDFIKISPNLTQDIGSDSKKSEELQSLVKQALGGGKQVILPYMEDPRAMAFGYQSGVQFVQGNFLAEPEPSRDYVWGE